MNLLLALVACSTLANAQVRPEIPKVWDDEALRSMELPLASLGKPVTPLSSAEYYKRPVLRIPKGYPVYHPDKEPPGYMQWLAEQPPAAAFDLDQLRTEADWIKAGEAVFYEPRPGGIVPTMEEVRNPEWFRKLGVPISRDGQVPWFRFTIPEKGKVVVQRGGCGMCHVRVLPDGSVIAGAQGNLPINAISSQRFERMSGDAQLLALNNNALLGFPGHTMPWLKPDPAEAERRIPAAERIAYIASLPSGVVPRIGTSLLFPPKIPDLIGVRERKYLDATGLIRNRGIGDLMRYAALVRGIEQFGSYDGFRPFGEAPLRDEERLASDEALYALALYLYSLQPPANPNRPSEVTRRGERVFHREGCGNCHTPPLYTNNKLTPVSGFTVPPEHRDAMDILPVVVGTDPRLAMQTRKGTGYYRVPSLKGVWYRGSFEHNGSVATLEDWFDPARLRDDYVPTGFKGYAVETRAVKGHEFGLRLGAAERAELIAFLRTL